MKFNKRPTKSFFKLAHITITIMSIASTASALASDEDRYRKMCAKPFDEIDEISCQLSKRLGVQFDKARYAVSVAYLEVSIEKCSFSATNNFIYAKDKVLKDDEASKIFTSISGTLRNGWNQFSKDRKSNLCTAHYVNHGPGTEGIQFIKK